MPKDQYSNHSKHFSGKEPVSSSASERKFASLSCFFNSLSSYFFASSGCFAFSAMMSFFAFSSSSCFFSSSMCLR